MQNSRHSKAVPANLSALSKADLAALLQEKDEQINKQSTEIKALTTRLNWFEEQVNLLKSQRYAKSSEQHAACQAELFDEDEETVQTGHENVSPTREKITYERNKKGGAQKRLDTSNLPREEHIIDLPEAEKQCACGCQLTAFGEERKEELVFIPATLKVIEHVRIKYTCRDCETVKTPAAVELPLQKSKAGAALLSEIMLAKYRYHLPFYRQSKIFATHNITLSANTLGAWVMRSAEALAPLGEAFWRQLAEVKVLQADETPVKVLKPEKKGYMWLYHSYLPGKRFVVFDFNLSRSAHVVDERLKDFQGLLQTDGYSGYNTQRRRPDVITLGCWDHCRRKFMDVIKACGNNKQGKAGKMLDKIQKLYALEQEIKAFPYDERQNIRQQKAKPRLAGIYSFLEKIHAPPKSLLGVAITYCKNQWPELTRYVDHGEAELSNCWTENQVRPFALGKRNWLFVGNQESAQKAALIYSLIQSCELNEIDPGTYLTYVLKQVHALRRGEIAPDDLLPNTIDKNLLKKITPV